MKLCYTKIHGEIVHDESDCPICILLDEKDNEIQELNDQIKKMENEIAILEKGDQ